MEFTTFVRKPFTVEAVEVTKENISDIAEHVGTLRQKEDGTPFIQVDRRLVPNIFRVYPGFWMTRMNDNIRCYSKRVFTEQFVMTSEEIDQWVQFMSTVNVSDPGNDLEPSSVIGDFGRIEDDADE